jgi:molybdate transport system substrate-binding protein
MKESRQSPRILIFAITMLVALPAASPAQVRVLMSGGFSAAYQELLLQFQNTTGITVTTARGASQGDGPNTIGAQLRRGVPADVVIMSRDGLAELFAEGRIAIGSDVDLARVPLGIGVRAGTPRPDIGTVDAFKQTLLRAKSIGTQSSSAIYMTTKLFPQLGIASAMAGTRSAVFDPETHCKGKAGSSGPGVSFRQYSKRTLRRNIGKRCPSVRQDAARAAQECGPTWVSA